MSPILHRSLALSPHPSAPAEAVRGIEVSVARDPNGLLALKYTVEGDVRLLSIPAARQARRADELWRHTCFEAFVATGAGAAYLELNFSPSGEWASYAFSGYRERAARAQAECASGEVPSITTMRDDRTATLEASIALECLRSAAPRRLAIAAVIEQAGGQLSYWALCHPCGKPDFHHPEGFALQI
ncbi:MAG TPA: DOMON-like domain-containing protein [Steroidobacteraceae bacterium]|nr:DOMON-like domain-containing protein [Steroidobacteraceae bacterium]